jgi:hypothetical protein
LANIGDEHVLALHVDGDGHHHLSSLTTSSL